MTGSPEKCVDSHLAYKCRYNTVLIGVCGGNFLRLLQFCCDLWEVELIMYLRDFISFQNCCLCLMVWQHQHTVENYALSPLAFSAPSSHTALLFSHPQDVTVL